MGRAIRLRLIRGLNDKLSAASMRLVKWTGKSDVVVHPKHLYSENGEFSWYLTYLEPGDAVLDVGCGNGRHSLLAAERSASIVGFDVSEKNIKGARRLAEMRGHKSLKFQIGDAECPWPFEEAAFNKVLLLDVLEHLNNRDGALKEARRVLKEGGQLILSVPNSRTAWKRRLASAGLPHYSDSDHKIEYTAETLAAELAAAGFEISGSLDPVVYDTPWAGLIDFVGGLSLSAYKRLINWKVRYAARHPNESNGFRAIARVKD